MCIRDRFNKAAERGKFEQSSEGSGGKSPKEKQEELRNTLGNVIREIGASENEIPQDLGRADRAMRQASRDLENGRPDEASNAQGRALEMIQRSINKINSKEYMSKSPQFADKGKENENNSEKEYLADNQNIEYQGTSAGGTVELPSKRNIKSASKIADELYNRFNEELVGGKARSNGVSAMSVSDMTGIPRATVIRKCKFLIENNTSASELERKIKESKLQENLFKWFFTFIISEIGIPSVIVITTLIPASAASIIALAANAGGTKIMLVSA